MPNEHEPQLMSIDDLKSEIDAGENELEKLYKIRDSLSRELQSINHQILILDQSNRVASVIYERMSGVKYSRESLAPETE